MSAVRVDGDDRAPLDAHLLSPGPEVQMAPTRPSPHFKWSEFDSHDGKQVPLRLQSGIIRLCAWWLEPMRAHFGTCTVVSGYRSALHNAAVGGKPHSVHLGRSLLPHRHGNSVVMAAAADVTFRDGTIPEWEEWARRHRFNTPELGGSARGGLGVYLGLGFVHLDTWNLRDWTG